jgi:hypothetical protein
MSRHDYSDDCDDILMHGRWRGRVASAIRGKRGQKLLKEMAEALDAMPVKRLIAGELRAEESYCALGVVGAKRGLDMDGLDPEDAETVAQTFDIAEPLAREIVYVNDESHGTPEQRWETVRQWVQAQIREGK